MKGVGELLEGLLPYSQRHYTRVDRLQRSTFLLDYTLTGMSVIEPERNDTEPRDVENVKETAPKEGEDYPASTKKRKTPKSQDKKQKKSKVAYVSSVAMSSQA